MTHKLTRLIPVTVIGLLLIACKSNSNDVPSLDTEQRVNPTVAVEQESLDDEAKVMAFVQCMRDEGLEFMDPTVDSDGNVQRPQLAEGIKVTREKILAPPSPIPKNMKLANIMAPKIAYTKWGVSFIR